MNRFREVEAVLLKFAGCVISELWGRLLRTRRDEMVGRISARLGVSITDAKLLAHQVYCTLGFGLVETIWMMICPSS